VVTKLLKWKGARNVYSCVKIMVQKYAVPFEKIIFNQDIFDEDDETWNNIIVSGNHKNP